MNTLTIACQRCAQLSLTALLLLATLLATSWDANAEGSLDRILHDKKVRVGWIASPPQMMTNPKSGKLEGYYIEAVREIFKDIDVEPEFIETNFASFVAALQSNQIDLCIASTFVTIKRAAVVDFTRPILYLAYSAVVRKNEKRFAKLQDFNQSGIKIAVLLGGSSQDYVRKNFPKAEVIALNTADQTAPFVEVASGRADVGINDAWSAKRFAAKQPSVRDMFAANPYNVQPTAWTVRKGNYELLNFLNAAIETLLVSGRFEQLAERYDPSGRFKASVTLVPFASK